MRFAQFLVAGAGRGDLRIGKRDAQRRTAQARTHVRVARGVIAGDAALVGRLRQQRALVVGVAADENRAVAALHGVLVEHRHAVVVAHQARVLQAQLVEVGFATDGRQQEVEVFGTAFTVLVLAGDGDLFAVLLHLDDLGIEAQVELVLEHLARHGQHFRVAQLRHAAAAPENRHAHAQPVQRLAQFQANHAGAGNGDRRRQVVPVKHVVTGDHARTGAPLLGHDRARAGGDDHPLGLDDGVLVDLQPGRAEETGVAMQLVLGRIVVHRFGDETDKPVALAAYARHHGAAVNLQFARLHAKRRRLAHCMSGVGSRDQ